MKHDVDVLIIGCGPGGASTATYLRMAGRSVMVLEKEKFPRFHIGESLLPYNIGLFQEMGVMPALEAAGFPKKFGAQFLLQDGERVNRFVFRNGKYTRFAEAIQVERSKFDHILMKRAQQVGADVREGWSVRKFTELADGVEVEAVDPGGTIHKLRANYLIDASGRNNFTGNQEKMRVIYEKHRKLAVFTHFTGVKLDCGERRGDTVIARLQNRWFWIIPISADKTSVGLVIDRADLEREGNDPEKSFWSAVESTPAVKARLAEAKIAEPVRILQDFSYQNKRLATARVLRVGDAAGFLDPIFSAGVYLAMWSGKLAAECVSKALQTENPAQVEKYERRVLKAMKLYWRLVEHFYTNPFMDLFMRPKPPRGLFSALVAVLAGELEGGFHIRWRLEVFYFLVWLQKRWPIAPRLCLTPMNKPMDNPAHAMAG